MSELILKQECYRIVGASMEVYNTLGPGFLEAVYQEALEIELAARDVCFVPQPELQILYKGQTLKKAYTADFLVFEQVIVEIKALNHILELTVPHAMQEGGTMVIPGHGRLCDQADVVEVRDMLTIIRDRVADLIAKGKSLAEVKAARPSRDYDRRYSTASWTGDMLVEAIYQSLRSDGGKKK
jgi:GxxExxY protein